MIVSNAPRIVSLFSGCGGMDLGFRGGFTYLNRYYRPTEVDLLLGDASKARKELGWEPKVSFKELAKMMVDADMKIAEDEKVLKEVRNR